MCMSKDTFLSSPSGKGEGKAVSKDLGKKRSHTVKESGDKGGGEKKNTGDGLWGTLY